MILRSTRLCKLASHVESYLFAGYMVELLKQGIPTRTALQYLEQIRKGSLFCELHKHLMNGLQNGEDILCVIEREVLLNDIFKQSFRIGSSTGSLCSMLQTGLQQQERTWGAAAEAYGSHRAVHCIQLCGCCGFACIPDYADPAYNAGTDVEIGKELNL